MLYEALVHFESDDRCRRKYPRVALEIPVEVNAAETRVIARTANLSLGGLLIRTAQTFRPGTELSVRFNLPGGHSISSPAKVAHATSGSAMGLEFLEMQTDARRVLADFTDRLIRHVRRGGRIARRYHLLLRRSVVGHSQEEMAETLVVSRHGGLLVCRAPFTVGDQINIWCPEKNRSADAKVIRRRLNGALFELGFEFRDTEDFWELEFPPEAEQGHAC